MARAPKELPTPRSRGPAGHDRAAGVGGAGGVGGRPGARPGRRSNDSNSALVYRTLRDRIVSGALPPGSRLVELALAAQLKVSRTPVREALKRLASEQLVLADASGGMTVHRPGNAEIEDIFEVREVLDSLAARLAAHRISDSDLARMRVVNDAMAEAIALGRRDQALVANDHFHDVIYQAAGNAVLARVGRDLRDYVRRFNTLPVASNDRVANVLADHAAILDALERHDPLAAARATAMHLTAARDYFVRVELRRSGEEPGVG